VIVDGSYHVSVTNNGCIGYDTIAVDFEVMPVSSFTVTPISATEFQFQNTSVGATAVLWDFGDGNTSIVSNPTHNYSSVGSYSVKLLVTNACGADSTFQVVTVLGLLEPTSQTLHVFPNPADDLVEVRVGAALPWDLKLTDITGNTMMAVRQILSNSLKLPVDELLQGAYLITIRSDEAEQCKILIVK
jgi:hypothetical protein